MADREVTPRKVPLTVIALALLMTPGVCARMRLSKTKPDAGAMASSATNLDRPPASASPNANAVAAPDASADASAANEAARAAALDHAKQLVADIRWMIKKGVTVNPAKAGEGDVATKCDEIAAARNGIGAEPDPELVKVSDEGSSLCAFDVPLLTASESLDHLRGTPSQASRLLMCNVAGREIAKARAVRPNDPRVRREEARRATVCNK